MKSHRQAVSVVLTMLLGAAVIFGQGRMFHGGMEHGGKIVKGAPYSATAVTQHVQVLPDGNRIVHSSTGSAYRDSEGRVRREDSFAGMHPGASETGTHQMIWIGDPVAGVHYMLDPQSHTARKMATGLPGWSEEASTEAGGKRGMHHESPLAKSAVTEALGTQTIEGLVADGTRITFTIPAGHDGNDAAVNVVEERWVSQELQVVVLSKRSDPRHGDTTYQLTNINRGEPARSLFEPPSDYTVTAGGPFGHRPMHNN